MSEDFMEGLFNNELTVKEYGKVIAHCREQIERLRNADEQEYYEEWADETNRIMEEDYD